MALIDRKVNDWSQAVSSLDDKPKMTAAALKAAFDSNSNQLKPAINGIIDDLTGSQGALNIGLTPIDGLSGSNVQAVLQAISLLIKSNDVDLTSLERLFTAEGASLVGLQPVSGVSASNLQQAIISLADTISKIDPYLGNPVAISQGGTDANDSQNALYNLGAKPNDNFIDNPYFNINQRGNTSFTTPNGGYIADRWVCSYGGIGSSVTINNTGNSLSIKSNAFDNSSLLSVIISQNLSFTPKGTVTISALLNVSEMSDAAVINIQIANDTKSDFSKTFSIIKQNMILNRNVVISHTININDWEDTDRIRFAFYISSQFGIQDNHSVSCELFGVKAEYGKTQTLARQLDDGSCERLEKLNYATELAECQRYLIMGGMEAIHITANAAFLPTPTKMRIKPSIIGKPEIYSVKFNAPISDTVITDLILFSNGIFFYHTPSSEPCYIYFPEGTGLSAEL